ncbi:MAG: inositol monophosphatase family protein [Candidatus Omnitrophota bacterium]
MSFKETAVKAARAAAEIHQQHFRKDVDVQQKSTSYNLVTEADTASEKEIIAVIKENYPEHGIMTEEGGSETSASPFTWVIDPLDGTNNYASGIPFFCTSVALAHEGRPVLGVIYDVIHDEMFYAEKGEGAFLNDQPICVNDVRDMAEALLITGFYYDRGEEMLKTLDNMRKFFEQDIMGLRRFGAAALDLCYVACGRAAGFWEYKLNPWDFAAAMLILQEAGGRITDQQGRDVPLEASYVVASNSYIHDKMLKTLAG